MSEQNVGLKCTIGLANNLYEIQAYSEKHGKQYLVRACGYYEGSIQYGWVEASRINVKKWVTLGDHAD